MLNRFFERGIGYYFGEISPKPQPLKLRNISYFMAETGLSQQSLEIIALFEKEGINSFEDFKKRAGSKFPTEGGNEIRIETKQVNLSFKEYMIMCRVKSNESFIEIGMNEGDGYSIITLKYDQELEGYKHYFKYPSGNILQDRRLPFSFNELINELKELSTK